MEKLFEYAAAILGAVALIKIVQAALGLL